MSFDKKLVQHVLHVYLRSELQSDTFLAMTIDIFGIQARDPLRTNCVL